MMGFMGKRKELEQVVNGLCDFSLSGPAAKCRRLVSALAVPPHSLPFLARLCLLELPSRAPLLARKWLSFKSMLLVQFMLGSVVSDWAIFFPALQVG